MSYKPIGMTVHPVTHESFLSKLEAQQKGHFAHVQQSRIDFQKSLTDAVMEHDIEDVLRVLIFSLSPAQVKSLLSMLVALKLSKNTGEAVDACSIPMTPSTTQSPRRSPTRQSSGFPDLSSITRQR